MPRHWKLPIYVLFFGILTFYALVFRPTASQNFSQRDILGARTNLELLAQPEAGREPILEKIRGAQKEILVEVYLLSDKDVLEAFTQAEDRGVKVQVILEEHPFGGGSNKSSAADLKAAGIATQWENQKYALTHEKAIIFDQSEVCILNQNLTTSSFTKNREYDICDTDLGDVSEAVKVFGADWEKRDLSLAVSNLVISPQSARGKITALIDGAKEAISMEMEILEDPQIVALLASRAKTIRVRVILPDLSKVGDNEVAARKLAEAGAEVRTMSFPYLHAKLITVDNLRSYVGSENLSSQSLDQNRELGIIISQGDILTKLNDYFLEDWQMSSDLQAGE